MRPSTRTWGTPAHPKTLTGAGRVYWRRRGWLTPDGLIDVVRVFDAECSIVWRAGFHEGPEWRPGRG